jgi:CRISPR/Cas system endoribonuclease Cas6 (RAMP superfamily)
VNEYNPVNQITMKNMNNLAMDVHRAQDRVLKSIPAKYHVLVALYAELTGAEATIDKALDNDQKVDFDTFHAIKDLTKHASQEAAETQPLFSSELKETITDVWAIFKPEKSEAKEIAQ